MGPRWLDGWQSGQLISERSSAGRGNPMSESDEFTIDAIPVAGGGFVGVVRHLGETIWSGVVRATKREALADARHQRTLTQAVQDDRDSKKVTMDLAAGPTYQSWGDGGALGL